ncbi:hypothetical protein WJX79_009689 [Trebouxia sp. C0005]
MDYGPSAHLSPEDSSQAISQLRERVQAAMVQEYLTTVRDSCFEKCVTKPSTSLSSSEQQCLARCMDRYAEATQIVTKSVLDPQG